MKILGMGVPELVIILIVALLIFGPKNLPKLGSALGKTVKNLRDGMGSVGDAAAEGEEEAEETVESYEVTEVEEAVEEETPFSDPEKPAVKKTAKKVVPKKAVEATEEEAE